MEQTTIDKLDIQDETNYEMVVKEELIIEDEPHLSTEEGEINEIVVKQEEELIIEDELDLPEEEDENDKFETTNELARHISAHKLEPKQLEEFRCEFCEKVFDAKTLYTKHLRRHRLHIFKCNLCQKTFPEKFNLTRHLKVKHEGIQTPNSASNSPTAEVESPDALDDEIIEQTDSASAGGEIDPFRYCEKCDKTFKTKQYCVTHKRRHKSVEKGLYKCVPCEKSFGSKFSLRLHVKSAPHKKMLAPQEDVELHCTVCDKIFHSKLPYSKHLKRHRPRNFHCNLCPKSFPVNCDLTRHLRHVHMVLSPTMNGVKVDLGSSKQEPIEDGSSSLEEDEDLLREMPQAALKGNTDETLFCCGTCNKFYKYKRSYENHLQRHALGSKIKISATE